MSVRPRHVSIFLPRDTPFYRGLLPQMRRGFEECGVETSGACQHLNAEEMADFCRKHKPDLIFEMNRPRCDAKFIPPEIKHALWVVDLNGRDINHFQGSDLSYFFTPAWKQRGPHRGISRWMGPGTCPHTYFPRDSFPEREIKHLLSFVGHIPKPWTQEELSRPVSAVDPEFTFGELLKDYEPALRHVRDRGRRRGRKRARKWGRKRSDAIPIAERICQKRTGASLSLDDRLRYDIIGRVIRHISRCDLLDRVVDKGLPRMGFSNGTRQNALAIYGPENWKAWEAYAPFYRGFLETPEQLREAFQHSLIQLHEGTGIHFRSMDAMASGSLLYFRRSIQDRHPGGILSHFEPFEHFVPFTPEDLPALLERYTKDIDAANKMREAGRAEVLRSHTWKCRAESILQDFAEL